MRTVEAALKQLDTTIAWADDIASYRGFDEDKFRTEPQLLCVLMGMRQIRLAKAVRVLAAANMFDGSFVLSRVMIEGSVSIWWIFSSPNYEKRVENWIYHVYREVNRIPPETDNELLDKGNISQIRAEAKALMDAGIEFKGSKWSVDENGKPVQISQMVKEFLEAKISGSQNAGYHYRHFSEYVHWSLASFSVLNTAGAGTKIVNEPETVKVSSIDSANNSLIILMSIVQERTSPNKLA